MSREVFKPHEIFYQRPDDQDTGGIPYEITDNSERSGLHDDLVRETHEFFDIQDAVLERRGTGRTEREERFIRQTMLSIMNERRRRAEEMVSPKVIEATQIAESLLPLHTYGVSCIDSRVMRTIIYGMPMSVGGFTRVQAGDFPEFIEAADGGLALPEDTYYANLLKTALNKPGRDIIPQVLDSHADCAAREREEISNGETPSDHGLHADVKRKKQIATAIVGYVKDRFPSKQVLPIQTSFDPRTGFMYMGLEKEDVLKAAERTGFTDTELESLALRRKIIDTETFIHDPRVGDLFERYKIPELDWAKNYKESMITFWRNMRSMVDEGLVDTIKEKVLQVYPDCSDPELKERAMLLAANAYNGVNLSQKEGGYPYAQHEETCVVVTEGENGPYEEHPSFSIFSKARREIVGNLTLAEAIIRDNRAKSRIQDRTQEHEGRSALYVRAPVPGIVMMVMRDERYDWDQIRAIDWSDLVTMDWVNMTTAQFQEYIIEKQPLLPGVMIEALNNLHEKMVILHTDHTVRKKIFEGKLAVLPVIADVNRNIQTVIPFINRGYAQKQQATA